MDENQSIFDSRQVWREFRKLFILGKLECAVLGDLSAGELATLLVGRVRELEREGAAGQAGASSAADMPPTNIDVR